MSVELCDCGHCREVPWCKCKGYRMTNKPDFVAMLRDRENESFFAADVALEGGEGLRANACNRDGFAWRALREAWEEIRQRAIAELLAEGHSAELIAANFGG